MRRAEPGRCVIKGTVFWGALSHFVASQPPGNWRVTMKTSSLGIALLASVAIGCNDSTGTASAGDLVGQWIASAYTVTSVANTSTSAELVGMGMTLTFTFTEMSYTGVVTFPGEPTENFSGTYTIDGQLLILDEADQPNPETMTYILSGNVLTLSGADTYDFDDDQQEDPATFVLVMDKQ